MFVPLRGRAMVLGVTCRLNIDLIDRENMLIILSKSLISSYDNMDNFSMVKNSERSPCILLWTESTNVALDADILVCSSVETMSSS